MAVQTVTRIPWSHVLPQTGILLAVADAASQRYVEDKDFKEMDMKRILRFGILGVIFVGPALRIWYGFVDRAIKFRSPVTTIVTKVAADQLVFTPPFLYSFITVNGLLAQKTNKQIKQELRTDYYDILAVNYQVWPLAQIVNFGMIPLSHQTLYTTVVAVFFNVYLSWKLNNNSSSSKR